MYYIYASKAEITELADHEGSFRRFRKQIMKFGDYVGPVAGEDKMHLTKKLAEEMISNFKSGKYDTVSVPLGHPKTDSEMAYWNRGEVIDLVLTEDGLDAVIEIRDDETVDKIDKRLIPSVSMGFVDNYLDKTI